MKRLKLLTVPVLILFLSMTAAACGSHTTAGGTSSRVTINVYNWGDYIAENTISDFETKYPNIKVNYETFTTNEDMYVKIKSGGSSYDVAIPSDYMIKRMLDEDMLNKINMLNIPNYSLIDNRFKNLSYDAANEYSIPYMWGTVGILYNKTMVEDKVVSWRILWDKKYSKQIFMPDSERDSIGITLKMLGFSMNTRKVSELEEAKKELMEQKPIVLAYVVDEVKDKMIEGEAALAVVWSGDAFYCISENKDLDYVIPVEGSNLWFDSMVIPKTSRHQKEAEIFINYMCETDTAFNNAEYIGYATPHTEARKKLDPELTGNRNAYPEPADLLNAEIFEYPGDETNKEYNRIWTEIKAN
jgi:spermidine/putrescine transport system substrate-binding protein